jgi:hypothetical protein
LRFLVSILSRVLKLSFYLAATLLLFCLVVIVLAVWSNFSSKLEVSHQLYLLDALFSVPRQALPGAATEDDVLPAQVGTFQRSEILNPDDCGTSIDVCFKTVYSTDDRKTIWLTAYYSPTQSELLMQQMAGIDICGAELGGESIIRTTSEFPYLYRQCNGFAISLDNLAWVNQDWLIQINSSYDEMTAFLNVFPY